MNHNESSFFRSMYASCILGSKVKCVISATVAAQNDMLNIIQEIIMNTKFTFYLKVRV